MKVLRYVRTGFQAIRDKERVQRHLVHQSKNAGPCGAKIDEAAYAADALELSNWDEAPGVRVLDDGQVLLANFGLKEIDQQLTVLDVRKLLGNASDLTSLVVPDDAVCVTHGVREHTRQQVRQRRRQLNRVEPPDLGDLAGWRDGWLPALYTAAEREREPVLSPGEVVDADQPLHLYPGTDLLPRLADHRLQEST